MKKLKTDFTSITEFDEYREKIEIEELSHVFPLYVLARNEDEKAKLQVNYLEGK